MNSKFLTIIFCVLLMAMGAKAWDTTPDAEGLYDGLYDRPTYFPEWEQPGVPASLSREAARRKAAPQ